MRIATIPRGSADDSQQQIVRCAVSVVIEKILLEDGTSGISVASGG